MTQIDSHGFCITLIITHTDTIDSNDCEQMQQIMDPSHKMSALSFLEVLRFYSITIKSNEQLLFSAIRFLNSVFCYIGFGCLYSLLDRKNLYMRSICQMCMCVRYVKYAKCVVRNLFEIMHLLVAILV